MNARFRLHDLALTRLRISGMPLHVLELLMRRGNARRARQGWEVAPADDDLRQRLGRFASARLLVADDGCILDILAGAEDAAPVLS